MGRAADRRRRRKGPGNEEVARRKAERSDLLAFVRGLLRDGAFKPVAPQQPGQRRWIGREKVPPHRRVEFSCLPNGALEGWIRRGPIGEDRPIMTEALWLMDEALSGPALPEEENPSARAPGDGFEPPAP